jgi:hypothetical protein
MEELATVRGKAQALRDMISLSAVGYHEDLLVWVKDGEVNVLMQTNANEVMTYTSFDESHFSEVSGEAKAVVPVGGSDSDAKGFLDYFQFAEYDGTIEMTFLSEAIDPEATHPRLAERWRAEGALNTELRLPASQDDLGAVPWKLPKRWTPDEEYASQSCLTDDGELPDDEDEWIVPPTRVETSAGTIRNKVMEPAEFADGVNYYPVAVEDGDFIVDVEGAQKDDHIWGQVNAESVEGPDVNRKFGDPFADVFGALGTHAVELQTAPDDGSGTPAPLAVVVDRTDYVLRHVIGPRVDS